MTRYQAFVSYSHAADGKLAPALQSGLQRFAKPWYRMRALRVFRDETNLSVNPALWSTIEAALRDSEYFIVLASPAAARSQWVAREIDSWLTHRTADHLLIVLTDGELVWDRDGRDFDWQHTTALPPAIAGVLREEPLYLDLRWARTADHLSLRDPRFRNAIADLAATLRGVDKDTLIGEDVRLHRRTNMLVTAVTIALAVLSVVALVSRRNAVEQRNEARAQRQEAERRLIHLNLANGAHLVDEGDLCGALAWFGEAVRLGERVPSEQALLRVRLASAARRCPTLSQVWSVSPGNEVTLVAGGGEVLALLSDESVRSWNAESGAPRLDLRGTAGRRVTDVSTDGTRLVSADDDDTARVWDATNGRELLALHHPGVAGGTFSADGLRIVTAGGDGSARIWDAGNGAELAMLPHGAAVSYAAFSADGSRIVTTADDQQVRVWNLATRRAVTVEHDLRTLHVELSPDGMRVLTVGAEDRNAQLWSATTGKWLSNLGDWAWADLATFSPDGRWVAMATRAGWIRLQDAQSDAEGKSMQLRGLPVALAFSPDGKRVATGGTDRAAEVWDVETGERVVPPLWHEASVEQVAFTSDGARLATVTGNGIVRLWSLRPTGAVALPHDRGVRSAVFDGSGRHVLTTTDFAAEVWDASGDGPITAAPLVLATGAQLSSASFSPDGTRVVTGDLQRTAHVWDASTGADLLTLPHDGRVSDCAYSSDGTRIATAAGFVITIWDAAAGRALASIRTDDPVLYVEFSRDGARVLSIDFGDTVRVWDTRSAKEIPSLRHAGTNRATYSDDGTRLATAGVDGAVQVWNAATGAAASPPFANNEPQRVTHLAFSPDGTRLVTASEGPTARVWNAATGVPVTPPLQHRDRVLFAAFSPDGTSVVTASGDHTARVWDAQTGEPLTPPLEHGGVVRQAVFGPDGRRLVSASEDDAARLWDVGPATPAIEQLVALARVASARRVDDTGALTVLTGEEFRQAWRTVHPEAER